jgi:hypothetical protein
LGGLDGFDGMGRGDSVFVLQRNKGAENMTLSIFEELQLEIGKNIRAQVAQPASGQNMVESYVKIMLL